MCDICIPFFVFYGVEKGFILSKNEFIIKKSDFRAYFIQKINSKSIFYKKVLFFFKKNTKKVCISEFNIHTFVTTKQRDG